MQRAAANFVCVAEECFFLYPPAWLKHPPKPESTRIFKAYVANAPRMWAPNTTTHQGIYCMAPDGGYLSGTPGLSVNAPARKLIADAWTKWRAKGISMKPVPTDPIPLYGGKDPELGSVKLQVAYRDLPRGDVRRPSSAKFQNPYNLGWFDLTAKEAASLVTTSKEPVAIDRDLFVRLATHTLKDAVRGQCRNFKPEDFKAGSMTTQLVSDSGGKQTFRLQGNADLGDAQRTYKPSLRGFAIYDQASKSFTQLELVAVGQRTGKSGANGRETDLGPAPMGVSFRLFK